MDKWLGINGLRSGFNAIARWLLVLAVMAVPLLVAAGSPLLQWRQPVYVFAGFAGILALALLPLQPLLMTGELPGLSARNRRRAHRWVGAGLLLSVLLHVAGLWVTSPPDVIDALLFRSPTPFSVWGVVGMWALIAAGLVAALRRRLALRATHWRRVHVGLALLVVSGSVLHAIQIEGTMGDLSKWLLCVLTLAALLWALIHRPRSR